LPHNLIDDDDDVADAAEHKHSCCHGQPLKVKIVYFVCDVNMTSLLHKIN